MQKYLYLNQSDRQALNRAINAELNANGHDLDYVSALQAVNDKLGAPKPAKEVAVEELEAAAPAAKTPKPRKSRAKVKPEAELETVEVPAAKRVRKSRAKAK